MVCVPSLSLCSVCLCPYQTESHSVSNHCCPEVGGARVRRRDTVVVRIVAIEETEEDTRKYLKQKRHVSLVSLCVSMYLCVSVSAYVCVSSVSSLCFVRYRPCPTNQSPKRRIAAPKSQQAAEEDPSQQRPYALAE